MRTTPLLLAAALVSPALAPAAQMPTLRPGAAAIAPRILRNYSDQPRAVIGVTTTGSATTRDTLGVLVSNVRAGSPADKAGIEEGNRIASVNGVSLRLAAADVGDADMAGVMLRRLNRELDKLKPGDDVDLTVYADGKSKNVKLKTIAPADLYQAQTVRTPSERATLGINLASTGSARDSLGVFVLTVEDNGPAAKAGVEEGSRIASINGVDLRGKRAEDDDYFSRTSNVTRLEREMAKVKPGDEVDLRIWFAGQYKNVKVKSVRQTDLPHRGSAFTITGGDTFMPMTTFPPAMARVDVPELGDQIRRVLEEVRVGGARLGNRVSW